MSANIDYWLNPGIKGAVAPLPVSKDLIGRPLPDSATLIIDNLRVNAPIVFNVPAKNSVIYKQLENGVVHYSGSPKPGQRGTAIVLGHSSAYPWYRGNYGSVFALMGKLQPGDRFQIRYGDGRVFTFEMKQALVFNPLENDARLVALEQSNKPAIILVSCWPVGTDYRRLAVKAELVE